MSAWVPALYFTFFGAVIAVFKDVPDVAGDDYPTFAKRFGKMETLHACRRATVGLVAAPSLWMLSRALLAPAALGSSTKLFLALLGAWTAKWFWTFEGAGEEAGVEDEVRMSVFSFAPRFAFSSLSLPLTLASLVVAVHADVEDLLRRIPRAAVVQVV